MGKFPYNKNGKHHGIILMKRYWREAMIDTILELSLPMNT
jgi:hypothetical protein